MLNRRRTIGAIATAALLGGGATAASPADTAAASTAAGQRSGCSRCGPIRPATRRAIAYDQRSQAFFVSSTGDGAIYRGTLGSDTVAPFIAGAPATRPSGSRSPRASSTSPAARTGTITVYDLATQAARSRPSTRAPGASSTTSSSPAAATST